MTTRMHNPPHAGEAFRDTVLAEGRISVSEFARRLGVFCVALSRVMNSRPAVSADMALRLAFWLQMQATYDLWHAAKKRRTKVRPLKVIS